MVASGPEPIYYLDLSLDEGRRQEGRLRRAYAPVRHFLRHLVRGELVGLRLWRQRFPILRAAPSTIDGILVKAAGDAPVPFQQPLYVNGVPVQAESLGVHCGHGWLWLDATAFARWENILSFPIGSHWATCVLHPAWRTLDAQSLESFREHRACSVLQWPSGTAVKRLPGAVGSGSLEGEMIAVSDPIDSTQKATSFLCNSVNSDGSSPFHGLCYGCYDLEAGGYRLPSWVWTSGIVIAALLARQTAEFTTKASQLGKRLLQFQLREGPQAGAFMVRYDPMGDVPRGFAAWLAPNDAAILGAYGLLSLFEATKEREYWQAAVDVADWIMREGFVRGRLRVGFRLETGKWVKSWLYLDAGFTPVLLARLYQFESKPEWQQACQSIMDDLIDRLYVRQGRFLNAWERPIIRHRALFARGHGWILDGLIETYLCTGQQQYLQLATECARFVCKYQNESGSWYYRMDKPDSGECNKGTPVLAYHLLRLHSLTEEPAFRHAAKSALEWCQGRQYLGPDQQAVGGIVSYNAEGAISTALNTRTAFPYASAFQVLAQKEWHRRS